MIDKWGFLWTGAGDYQWGATLTNPGIANSTSISGGTHGVLRIPVGAVTGDLASFNGGHPTFFPVSHETNVRLPLGPVPVKNGFASLITLCHKSVLANSRSLVLPDIRTTAWRRTSCAATAGACAVP